METSVKLQPLQYRLKLAELSATMLAPNAMLFTTNEIIPIGKVILQKCGITEAPVSADYFDTAQESLTKECNRFREENARLANELGDALAKLLINPESFR